VSALLGVTFAAAHDVSWSPFGIVATQQRYKLAAAH